MRAVYEAGGFRDGWHRNRTGCGAAEGGVVINGSSASGYEVACMVGVELTLQIDFFSFFFLKQLIYLFYFMYIDVLPACVSV